MQTRVRPAGGWLLACVAAMLVQAGPAIAAVGTYVPGIIDPSLPQITNSVTVRANRGNWTISGNRNSTF